MQQPLLILSKFIPVKIEYRACHLTFEGMQDTHVYVIYMYYMCLELISF